MSFNPVLTESSMLKLLVCIILSYFTGSSSAIYERGTNAFFLERASLSSLPFGIDDPPKGSKGNDISDLIVDLYQGGKTANLHKGALSPKSLPLVASNFSIQTEARYILCTQYFLAPLCMHRYQQLLKLASTFVFHIFNLTGIHLCYISKHILHCPLNVPLFIYLVSL